MLPAHLSQGPMLLCSGVLRRLLEPHRPPLLGYHTGPGGTRGRRQVLVWSPRFGGSVWVTSPGDITVHRENTQHAGASGDSPAASPQSQQRSPGACNSRGRGSRVARRAMGRRRARSLSRRPPPRGRRTRAPGLHFP